MNKNWFFYQSYTCIVFISKRFQTIVGEDKDLFESFIKLVTYFCLHVGFLTLCKFMDIMVIALSKIFGNPLILSYKE